MLDETENDSCKVVLIGETAVGKTSIISQFIEKSFESNILSTTGAIYSSTKVKAGDKEAKLEIWDTAGQEKYRALTKMFYKDATAAVIVYDITKLNTFNEIKNYWVNELKQNAPANIITVIVANKSDLYENEEVDEKEAREYAKSMNALFKKTSAKNAEGIENLFLKIGSIYISQEHNKSFNNNSNQKLKLNNSEQKNTIDQPSKAKKCC